MSLPPNAAPPTMPETTPYPQTAGELYDRWFATVILELRAGQPMPADPIAWLEQSRQALQALAAIIEGPRRYG